MTDTASGSDIAVEPEVASRRKVLIIRLSVWLSFGVIVGSLPLIASMIRDAMSRGGLSLTEVLKGGDLFVISAVVAAGALGELLAVAFAGGFGETPRVLPVLAGCWTFLAFVGNTIAYTAVSVSSPATVVNWSLVFFPLTILASGLSVGTVASQ